MFQKTYRLGPAPVRRRVDTQGIGNQRRVRAVLLGGAVVLFRLLVILPVIREKPQIIIGRVMAGTLFLGGLK